MEKENKNEINVLDELNKGACMGMDAIHFILDKVEDNHFKQILETQYAQYQSISNKICEIIDKATDPWGIKVENVELKDVALPEEMKRVIARVAEAEREKRAVITKAEGEVEASNNLAKAAENMSKNPVAVHLRTLETLNDLSSDQSNTVVFALPIDVLKSFDIYNKKNSKE